MYKFLLTFGCITCLYNLGVGQAGFNIPDSICVGQSFTVVNTSVGGSTFYWNFCSGNLASNPIGENLGNLGNLSKPVYSAIIKDGANYVVFITNLGSGTISRLDFGTSLSNNPVATNLGNLGILVPNIEGIQIKKDLSSGIWYGLVAGFSNNFIIRLNFGTSLQNVPTAENLGNVGDMMERSHTLYTFEENNNWFTLVGNYSTNRLTLLSFGNSLANFPTAKDLGNVGNLNGPVGFYPVEDKGNWYLYVANQIGNSISRLDFGNSLTNQPTGVNLGNIGSVLNAPRSIIIIRDCGVVLGFIVNELTNDVVRIAFPNGLTSQPTGVSLGNIATFSFPHHISQMFRDGDAIYCLVTNVNNNTLSRFMFKGCPYPSFPSSNLKDPPMVTYGVPGVYNISLIVDEGLPTQTNVCKQISVVVPNVSIGPAAPEICEGNSVSLSATGATTYLWAPSVGLSSPTGAVVSASPTLTTSYTVVGSAGPGCSASKTIEVKVNPKPIISVVPDHPPLCKGDSVILQASGASGFLWSPANGLSSVSSAKVAASPAGTITYTLTGTDQKGCTAMKNIQVTVNPKPILSVIDTECEPQKNTYLIGISSTGDKIVPLYGTVTFQNGLYQIANVPNKISDRVVSTFSSTGCKDSLVVTAPSCVTLAPIFVPESFSPNGDGINDYFVIPGIDAFPNAVLTVFTGYGQKVFEDRNYKNGWDGSSNTTTGTNIVKLPTGTYYYILQLDSSTRIIKGFVYIAY